MDNDALADKKKYFDHWGLTIGEPRAEEEWKRKKAMDRGERRGESPMFFIGQDVHYESPITGAPITSRSARADDMARSGCIEYDPEMKKDAERRRREQSESFSKSVDESVDMEIAKMSTSKKEALASELLSGVTAEVVSTNI